MKKYELTKETVMIGSRVLYRIRSLVNFNDVKVGELGGFIETESNLSHEGNCWVYKNGKVYENGRLYGNGRLFGNGKLCGNGKLFGNGMVYDNGELFGNGKVSGNGQVFGNGKLFGNGSVYDNGIVNDNSMVYGNGQIFENGTSSEKSRVFGNGKVYQHMLVKFGSISTDLGIDKIASIQAQTGLKVISDIVFCYKHVSNDLSSLYDPSFFYKVGEKATAKNPELSSASCTSGLHVSHPNYWDYMGGEKTLFCRVNLDDIITVQQGKIRCKSLFVIGVCDGQTF